MKKKLLFLPFIYTLSLFSQDESQFKRSEMIQGANSSPSYLLAASPKISESGYNPFFEASFLYYKTQQEGLTLASTGTFQIGSNLSYETTFTNPQYLIEQPTKFSPAFKITAGYAFDSWDLYSEFYRITSHTHTKQFAPSSIGNSPVFITQTLFQAINSQGINPCGPAIESDFRTKIYTLDLLTRRSSYISRHLSLSPYFGLQAVWIYQHLNVALQEQENSVPILPQTPIYSQNSSKFWSIGPKMGFSPRVLLPKNFSIYSDINWSLVYGQYDVYHRENAISANQVPDHLTYHFKNQGCLRTILQLSLGAGWSKYFLNNRYFASLNIGYDFFIYPEQNIIKRNLDRMSSLRAVASESLMIQGLNISIALKF